MKCFFVSTIRDLVDVDSDDMQEYVNDVIKDIVIEANWDVYNNAMGEYIELYVGIWIMPLRLTLMLMTTKIVVTRVFVYYNYKERNKEAMMGREKTMP